MQGYLETVLPIITDNSEILTDWIIALSMAWGAGMFTVLGIVFLILYARGKHEETYNYELSHPYNHDPHRVWRKDTYFASRVHNKFGVGNSCHGDRDNK